MPCRDPRDTPSYKITTGVNTGDTQYQNIQYQYQNQNINVGDFVIKDQNYWWSTTKGVILSNDPSVEIGESILKDPEALKEYLKMFNPNLSLVPEKVLKHVVVKKTDIEHMDPKEIARLRLNGVTIIDK